MLDLKIDLLRLNINGDARHEPRFETITRRAITLFADRLAAETGAPRWNGPVSARNIEAPDARLDLDRMSDAEAADQLANSLLDSIRMKLNL